MRALCSKYTRGNVASVNFSTSFVGHASMVKTAWQAAWKAAVGPPAPQVVMHWWRLIKTMHKLAVPMCHRFLFIRVHVEFNITTYIGMTWQLGRQAQVCPSLQVIRHWCSHTCCCTHDQCVLSLSQLVRCKLSVTDMGSAGKQHAAYAGEPRSNVCAPQHASEQCKGPAEGATAAYLRVVLYAVSLAVCTSAGLALLCMYIMPSGPAQPAACQAYVMLHACIESVSSVKLWYLTSGSSLAGELKEIAVRRAGDKAVGCCVQWVVSHAASAHTATSGRHAVCPITAQSRPTTQPSNFSRPATGISITIREQRTLYVMLC